MNDRLRAQPAQVWPWINGFLRALTLVDREIANYTRAIARGDFTSLDAPLGADEHHGAILQAELPQLDGRRRA